MTLSPVTAVGVETLPRLIQSREVPKAGLSRAINYAKLGC